MNPGPSDEIVKSAIFSIVEETKNHLRPNKLRKIVCKRVDGTSWTQFQRVLDGLIHTKSLATQEKDGEKVILSLSSDAAPPLHKQQKVTKEIVVPFEIIMHLTKKGQKKKKNLEINTKTKLTFDDETVKATRNLATVKTSTITISKYWNSNENGTEAKAKREAQMKAAGRMIGKMVKSFQENPDHFVVRKPGGTLAQQDEVNSIKQKAKSIKQKRKSNGLLTSTKDDDDSKPSLSTSKRKKQRSKFY